jgi:hypothetical protein
MADQTTNVPQLMSSQAAKEILANALFDAASPAMLFGRNAQTTSGIVWGYLGGRTYLSGSPVVIPNGTLTLTANQTNYIEVNVLGAVSSNTTGFTERRAPLYKVTTGSTTITNYEDHRSATLFDRVFYSRVVIPLSDADVTFTVAHALCHSIELTGNLTAPRNVIVPTIERQYLIYANTTNAQGIVIKTAAGTGVTLSDGQRRFVECDGVNVNLIG